MQPQTIEFLFFKEKVHSVRYKVISQEGNEAISDIYVKKTALGKPIPKRLVLTLASVED